MRKVTLNAQSYDMDWYTGKIIKTTQRVETRVWGGGGGPGNTPVNVHSTTINHQEIFLVDGNGKERVLRLRNMNLAGREGHELAVVQVSRDGAGEPDVVTIQNRTLNETYYNDSFFTKMFMPSVMWWILTPMAMLVAAWLLPTVLGVLVIVALPVYVFRRFRKGRQAIKAVKASGQFLPG